jgi:hypothetical protein
VGSRDPLVAAALSGTRELGGDAVEPALLHVGPMDARGVTVELVAAPLHRRCRVALERFEGALERGVRRLDRRPVLLERASARLHGARCELDQREVDLLVLEDVRRRLRVAERVVPP